MLIKAGSALIVPRSASMRDVSEHVADNAQLSLAPEIVNRKASVKAGKRETVASIAKRYRVSASDVADWNDTKLGATFKAGQPVVLYLPVRMAKARSTERVKADIPTKASVQASKTSKPRKEASSARKPSRTASEKPAKATKTAKKKP